MTLGNGACGLMSIAVSTTGLTALDPTEAAFYSAVWIFAGMLFDGLDGQVARATRQESEFGTQLDSLCDGITFGVAPVFIVLSFSQFYHPHLLWAVGIFFALCALLRLARFNTDPRQRDHEGGFRGLPSPAAAGTIASFAVAMPALVHLTEPGATQPVQQFAREATEVLMLGMPVLTLALACLMVSQIRYPHILEQWFRRQGNVPRVVQALLIVLLVAVNHQLALPLLFCLFAFGHPVAAAWTRSKAPLARAFEFLGR
jgi:CDP-diacylglycerol--serine O-phosphatidyltransferase